MFVPALFPGGCEHFAPRKISLISEGRTSIDPKKLQKGLLKDMTAPGTQKKKEIFLKKLAHGYRGSDPDLLYLSPHEFERWWRVVPNKEKHQHFQCAPRKYEVAKAVSVGQQHTHNRPVLPYGAPSKSSRARVP